MREGGGIIGRGRGKFSEAGGRGGGGRPPGGGGNGRGDPAAGDERGGGKGPIILKGYVPEVGGGGKAVGAAGKKGGRVDVEGWWYGACIIIGNVG